MIMRLFLPAALIAAMLAAPAPAADGALPQALAKTSFVCGTVNLEAKYYIYLHSASWCGPCRRAMPAIVQAYPAMREAGFEIILAGHDSTEAEVRAYAESHHAPFPARLASQCYADKLPGYRGVCGIPRFCVVDRNGKLLHEGHPNSFFPGNAWKSILAQWEQNAR